MRDDLLDAQASVDWAVSQIPILQTRFISWQRDHPYSVVSEPDPDTGEKLIVARESAAFDLTFNAEAGAIINAIRSSLDMLAAALAQRNGVKPTSKTHFPIYTLASDFLDPIKGIKNKKWLSKAEIAAIKTFRPYKGGDDVLYSLHQLDILRKHERLLTVKPIVTHIVLSFWGPELNDGWQRLQDKTILLRLPADHPFLPTNCNTQVAAGITFNEIAAGLVKVDVFRALRAFAKKASDIIKAFDSP